MWTIWRFQGDTGTRGERVDAEPVRDTTGDRRVGLDDVDGLLLDELAELVVRRFLRQLVGRQMMGAVGVRRHARAPAAEERRGSSPATTAFTLRRISVATRSLVALPAFTKPIPVTPPSVWTSTIWMPPGSVRGWRDAL